MNTALAGADERMDALVTIAVAPNSPAAVPEQKPAPIAHDPSPPAWWRGEAEAASQTQGVMSFLQRAHDWEMVDAEIEGAVINK